MNRLLSRHEGRFGYVISSVVVTVSFLLLLYAIHQLWSHDLNSADLVLCGGLYAITAMSITVSFHRLITHRSFVGGWPVRSFILMLGSMAVEGSIGCWVAAQLERHAHGGQKGGPRSSA